MGWLKRWIGLAGTQGEHDAHDDFEKPLDPQDGEEITILVKIKYRDDTSKEHEARINRNAVPTLVEDLMNFDDVKSATVYEEISFHHKSYSDDTQTIALGAALGASMVGGFR